MVGAQAPVCPRKGSSTHSTSKPGGGASHTPVVWVGLLVALAYESDPESPGRRHIVYTRGNRLSFDRPWLSTNTRRGGGPIRVAVWRQKAPQGNSVNFS